MDGVIIRDVVAVVSQRRRKEWHQPYRIDPEFLQVIELLLEPEEITNAIPVAVVESSNVHLIDDRVLVPKGVRIHWQPRSPRALPIAFRQSTPIRQFI